MRKNTILLTFAIVFPLILNAGVKDFIPLPKDSSKIISLDGSWPFKLLDGNDLAGYEDFYKPEFDCSDWQKIQVPGCWDAMGLIEPRYIAQYDNTGLYKMDFDMPVSWKGRKVTVFAEGVLTAYDMWVNGHHVGKWTLAHNGNMIDITDFVAVGKNDISICVRTNSVDGQFDTNDDWNSAGINRSIRVFAVPDNFVRDIHITSKLNEGGAADVSFDIAMEAVRGAFFKAVIKDGHGDIVHEFSQPAPSDGEILHYVWNVTEPQLWTAETPYLYTVEYSVGKGKKLKDGTSYVQRFGIREVRIDGTRLLVNNVPVKLRGVCYHESDYLNGKTITDSLMLKDMALMKMGNINFIRCSHYPKRDRFYELCDSLGFYVMNEVPMGFGAQLLFDPELEDNQILRADATVAADKNHPCVIVRSIGNENRFGEIYENTGKHVKELDPSIPICYPLVGSYFDALDYDIPEFVDIYTPHYPTPEVLKGYIARNDKPMILTEYCHSFGSSLEDHDVLWELIQENESMAGGALWHWNDQGMICKADFPGKYAWTIDVWTDEETRISLGKLDGNDGIVYPTRDLHPDFFNVRRNYCPVRFISDKVVPVPAGYMTASRMDFEVENRYDFLNLKDVVEIEWELNDYSDGDVPMFNGRVIPDCEPGGRCTLSVMADLQDVDKYNWLLLRLKVVDKTCGQAINEMTYLLNDDSGFRKIFTKTLKVKSDKKAKDYLAEFPLWRAGRKPMLPDCSKEVTRTIEPVTPSLDGYLLFPSDVEGSHYTFSNDKISFEGDIDIIENDAELDIRFDMRADRDDVPLRAAGIAMLLDKDLRYFQWFGMGPYPSWPGKDNANVLDRHALQAGDLYFEGDRMGVTMLLCTDVRGNGIIIVSDCGNFNFEETDRGVVVSIDPVLSGLGPKFGPSAHVAHSSECAPVAATVRVIPVSADGWSDKMTEFFQLPEAIGKYNPFITAYDIYLNRFPEK